jgi:hypothetical protein
MLACWFSSFDEFDIICHNPSLRLATKARGCKVAGQDRSPRVIPHAPENARRCEGIDPHTPKGIPTLGVGVLVDSWMFRKRLQGSKPNGLKIFLCHWKDIETQMSKMGLPDPFEYLKHKLWPKERSGIKLAIWFLITKSRESTQFPCVQVAWDITLESFWQRIQLCFRPHFNPKSTSEIVGVPTLTISGLPFGSPGTKCHLDVGLVERHRIYYKGEGGGFPQVQAMVSLVSLSCS